MTDHDKELLLRTFVRVLFGSVPCIALVLNFGKAHPVLTGLACIAFATVWMFVTDDSREGTSR